MDFENYSKRINSVIDIENFGQLFTEKQKKNRFALKKNNMYFEEVEKSKFAQINDEKV